MQEDSNHFFRFLGATTSLSRLTRLSITYFFGSLQVFLQNFIILVTFVALYSEE